MQFQIGDMVTRASYQMDIMFRIIRIDETDQHEATAILHGNEVRLIADAKMSDLVLIQKEEQLTREKDDERKINESLDLLRQDYQLLREKQEYYTSGQYQHQEQYFHMPGKVLHLDGDASYLKKCLDVYERIGVPVYGVHCHEKKMPSVIDSLLDQYRPDILVITGHDAYSKQKGGVNDIGAYRHSRHFVETVQKARKKIPHLDQLVIFGRLSISFRIIDPSRCQFCKLTFTCEHPCARSRLYRCEDQLHSICRSNQRMGCAS